MLELDPHPLDWFTVDDSAISVALVFPMQGAAGIFEPACELCARLAAEEINHAGGVLGKELRLLPVDGGAEPREIADRVEALVELGVVQGVTGWHISSVRQALAPRIAHRVPYVYTALYEGGEHTTGVFLTSETPDDQLRPAMRLLAGERRVRRWFVVGNDYVWPRRTARAARAYARESGGDICGQAYLPLGTHEFDAVLRRIEESRADAVLMLLVGSDAVRFNRAFAAAGLDQCCPRLSTLMDENMLMASGPTATADLYSTAGFFASLANQDTLDFHGQYAGRFGVEAAGRGQPRRILLRGRAVARRAHRPRPDAGRGGDRRGGRLRVLRGTAGTAAAAGQPCATADLPRPGGRRGLRRPHPARPRPRPPLTCTYPTEILHAGSN